MEDQTRYPMGLPKGMEPPLPERDPEKENPPVPVSLAKGNYVAAIHQALSILPVEIKVEKCLVVERVGKPPEVRLDLVIVGEKDTKQEISLCLNE